MPNHMCEYPMNYIDEVYHALSDPTRRGMLEMPAKGERMVTELAAPFSISLQSFSKHIKVLKRAGLFSPTVSGRTHICRFNPTAMEAAIEWMRFYCTRRHWITRCWRAGRL